MLAPGVTRTGTAVVAVVMGVATVLVTGGAGAVDLGRGSDRAPSGRTSVSSVDLAHRDVTLLVTSVWRPR